MKFPSLFDAFDHQVAFQGDKVALIAKDRSTDQWARSTWHELAHDVDCLARGMSSVPFSMVHSDNTRDQIIEILALMRMGIAEVSIDAACHPPILSSTPLDAEAALVLFTSGTTGEPKGVVLTHANLVGNAVAKLAAVPQSVDDVRLMVLPMSHAYARTCDFGTWLLSGCTLAVTLGYRGLRELAPIVRPTLMNVVPTIAYKLLQADLADLGLDRLHLLGCGGAPILTSAFQQFKSRGVTVIQGYGLTETSPVICSATPDSAIAGLVGDFVEGWQHEIRDGQLFVRGPHVMQGYWGDPPATQAKIDADGWLRTGDQVERDPTSGQMRILGRVDDVIVMDNGLKISPGPIEREIQQIAGVEHAMLVWRGRLELWVDGNADDSAIEKVLANFTQCHNVFVGRFDPALSQIEGELTAKGTVRRNRVRRNRFSEATDPNGISLPR